MKTRRDLPVRWFALSLVATAMFGSYYAYDNASALKQQLQHALKMNDRQFNLLYTVYSIPNMGLPLLGGYIVDHFGANKCILLFSSLVLAGQFVFATGVSAGSFTMALTGRAIFGLGGESLCVAQFAAIARWFGGMELALAMGISTTMTRFGTVINDFVSPRIYTVHVDPFLVGEPPAPALWFGFWVCFVSTVSGVVLLVTDRVVGRRLKEHNGRVRPSLRRLNSTVETGGDSLLGTAEQMAAEDDSTPSFSDIQFLGRRFWLLASSCACTYAAIYPFNNVAGGILQTKYGMKLKVADVVIALPYFISAVLSPGLGSYIDRFGRRSSLMVSSSAMIALSHLMIGFTEWTPYVPLTVLGLGFSVFGAAVWPSVALVVAQKAHGTAYGLTTSVQNCLMAVVPLIAGYLKDIAEARDPKGLMIEADYQWVEFLFFCLAATATMFGAGLMLVDRKKGSTLRRVSSMVLGASASTTDIISISQMWHDEDAEQAVAEAGDDGLGSADSLAQPLLEALREQDEHDAREAEGEP